MVELAVKFAVNSTIMAWAMMADQKGEFYRNEEKRK